MIIIITLIVASRRPSLYKFVITNMANTLTKSHGRLTDRHSPRFMFAENRILHMIDNVVVVLIENGANQEFRKAERKKHKFYCFYKFQCI